MTDHTHDVQAAAMMRRLKTACTQSVNLQGRQDSLDTSHFDPCYCALALRAVLKTFVWCCACTYKKLLHGHDMTKQAYQQLIILLSALFWNVMIVSSKQNTACTIIYE